MKEVRTRRDLNIFLNIPRCIYKNRREVVPDDRRRLKKIIHDIHNNVDGFRELRLWFIEGWGRIAALFDPESQEGWFGYFDVKCPGTEAAMLLHQALNYLKEKGALNMTGPVSFAERDRHWGMMHSGQDRHAWGENYHVPGLCAQMASLGFVNTFEQYTYEIKPPHQINPSLIKLADRVNNRFHPEIQTLSYESLIPFLQKFTEVYNLAWPQAERLTRERVQQLFREMKPVLLPKLAHITEVDGRPIGIFAAIQEPGQFLKGAGKFKLISLWRCLRFKFTPKNQYIRGVIFGVIPEFQRRGMEAFMIKQIHEAVQTHAPEAVIELSWIGSFNKGMMKMVEKFGAEVVKTHVVWTKNIT